MVSLQYKFLLTVSADAPAPWPNDARSFAVTAIKLQVYRGPLKFWICLDVIHSGPQGLARNHQI